MTDSLLVEALGDARMVLDELHDEEALGVKELRARSLLLERAAALQTLRPAARDDVVKLAKLILDLRDEAVELRRRHRFVRQHVHLMMD